MYSLQQMDQMSAYEHACQEANSISKLERVMKQAVSDAGARIYSYHHLSPTEERTRLTSALICQFGYDDGWINYYNTPQFVEKDPVSFLAFELNRPYWWDEAFDHITDRFEREKVIEAMQVSGLKCGLSLPVFIPGQKSGLSLLGFRVDKSRISDELVSILQWAGQISHQRYLALSETEYRLTG